MKQTPNSATIKHNALQNVKYVNTIMHSVKNRNKYEEENTKQWQKPNICKKTLPLDSSIAKATTNVEITSKSLGSKIETFCKVTKPDFTKKSYFSTIFTAVKN